MAIDILRTRPYGAGIFRQIQVRLDGAGQSS